MLYFNFDVSGVFYVILTLFSTITGVFLGRIQRGANRYGKLPHSNGHSVTTGSTKEGA